MKRKLKNKDREVELARQKEREIIDREQNEKIDTLIQGNVAMMRDHIARDHDFYMKARYMPLAAKDNLTRLYTIYKAEGGNDVGTKMYDDMIALPESKEYANKGGQ